MGDVSSQANLCSKKARMLKTSLQSYSCEERHGQQEELVYGGTRRRGKRERERRWF